MDLSIIIVSYNTRKVLFDCLKSVLGSKTRFKYEVIVSDNGSVDGTQEMIRKNFPQVYLLENHANLGFSKGNNVAIRKAQGRLVLLLNSDTVVSEDTFENCIGKMDQDQRIGILGCKVLLADGTLDLACRRKFPNPWNSFLRLFGLRRFSDYNIKGNMDSEMAVDAVMGAFLMIRKSVIDRIGLLDEDYFMYGEDLDWCWQAKIAGYQVWYYPETSIVHYKYSSSQSIPYFIIRQAHSAMKIFYRKHYAPNYPKILNWIVFLGINVRMFLVIVVNFFRNKKSVH